MRWLGIGAVVLLIGSFPAFGEDDSAPVNKKAQPRSTVRSVSVLAEAELQVPAADQPAKPSARSPLKSVGALAELGDRNEQQEPKPRAERAKPVAKAPKEARDKEGRDKEGQDEERRDKAAPLQPRRQPQERENKRAADRLDQFHGGIGWQPGMGNPWFGNQWNADPWAGQWGNGFSNSRIIGYRSFGFSSGFTSPYVYPGYFGYSSYFGGSGFFGPAPMPTISGPVTVRYDDPLGRQHKMVDESVRRSAEDPLGLRGR